MTHTEPPILQGKVKSVYDVPGEADKVTIQFHDKVTAWNGKRIEYPEGKGKVCCLISALLFEKLERMGIRTHYLGTKGLDTLLCRKLTKTKTVGLKDKQVQTYFSKSGYYFCLV